MKLLVFGGTAFLSRVVAQVAVERGHDVTCVARGESGVVPVGTHWVRWDRAEGALPAVLTETTFDAVVDVARIPSWVREAVKRVSSLHWVFVSTISVYSDVATAGGGPSNLPVLPALMQETDPNSAPEAYGAMKSACEEVVRSFVPTASVVRPGLIVGPGDPTGRFTYWPNRLIQAEPGERVLAPGDPQSRVQVIDVRDLASWVVMLAHRRTAGIFDAVGPAMSMADLLRGVAEGVGATPAWAWAPDTFLLEHNVQPWAGEHSMPLWLPRPAFDGMLDHDSEPSRLAGLTSRPIADTARDTAQWLRDEHTALATGLSRSDERTLLAKLTSSS